MVEPEESFATVQDAKDSPLEQEKSAYENFVDFQKKADASFSGGYMQAAPRYAQPVATPERSVGEVFRATMSEGLSADAYRALTADSDANYEQPDFDYSQFMRPQDQPFIGYLASIKNEELFKSAQADIDRRNQNLRTMSARPGVTVLSSFADPVELALGAATVGAFNALSLPVMAGITAKSVRAAQIAARSPRLAKVAVVGAEGALEGAVQTGLSIEMQANLNQLKNDDELAHHMAIGSLVGGMLGGSVGMIGKTKTTKLIDDFAAADKYLHVYGEASAPRPGSPDFAGPMPRYETGLRMQGAPEINIPKTKAQIATEAEALALRVGKEGLPVRSAAYAELKATLTTLGEAAISKLPKPAQQALNFVAKPLRNMSYTNKLISSKFGVAKFAALRFARNATEVMGTRTGTVLERNVQNKLEDMSSTVTNLSVNAYEGFLKINNIKPGAFAGERLKAGKIIYPENKFYEDIGSQILHVNQTTEHTRGAPEIVKDIARQYYKKLYEPVGNTLKDYGYLPKNADIKETINYLNRTWDTTKLMSDPDGFTDWMANYFREVNEALKSIKPNYDKVMQDAAKMKAIGNRFVKAADKIDKLNTKIAKRNILEKLKGVEVEASTKTNAVINKYETLKAEAKQAKEMLPKQVAELKADVKATAKQLLKEKEDTLKKYNDKQAELKASITGIRSQVKINSLKVLKGDFDEEIVSKIVQQHFEQNYTLSREAFEMGATKAEKRDLINDAMATIDDSDMRLLRRQKISEFKLEAVDKIDAIKPEINALKKERTEFKNLFDKELLSLSNESLELMKKKTSPEVNQSLRIKYLNLKERYELYKIQSQANVAKTKLVEPIIRLDFLQRKYSGEGLAIVEARKRAEKMAAFIPDAKVKKTMLAAARKEQRIALRQLKVKNEARALGEDFRAASEREVIRAEAMIPDQYRSTSTGKPYRIFDESIEPTYAKDQATKTFNTMIGTDDEVILNPTLTSLGGGPSILKPRNINMPDTYPGIENFVNRDVRFLAQSYARGASPVIAMHEMMQSMNTMQVFRDTVKRIQVEKYGAKRALSMPDEMVKYTEVQGVLQAALLEEHRINSKGLVGKELEAATAEYKKAKLGIDKVASQVMGTNAEGFNINASDAADFVDNFNAAISTVTTSNIVISMLSDSMSAVYRYGGRKYIEKGIAPLLTDPALFAMTKAELKGLNIALKTGTSAILKNKISGNASSLKNSKFGVFVNNLSSRLQNITGSSTVQDTFTIAATTLIKTDFLDVAQSVSRGTVTAKQLTHLAQRGVSPEDAKLVAKLFDKYGWSRGKVKGIDPSKMKSMTPEDGKAFTKYMDFINDELKATQVQPGIGSLPDWSGNWAGKSVLYLKRWFFVATNDLFVPAIQRADSEAMQGFLGTFAIGALQTQIRRIYRGQELDDDFSKPGFVVDAMTNSGLLGIYSFPVDIASMYGFLPSMGGSRYNPGNGLASYVAGPGVFGYSDKSLQAMSKLYKIATDEDRQFTFKDFNYIANMGLPMYKFAPISAFAQPRLKEYFESQGRLE